MKRVWVNGCFDILHRGHIELFKYSKSLGDNLIVGVDSDQKVKKDKGATRPFNTVEDRIFILESIRYIDEVVMFDTRLELENWIRKIEPDILVVGSDWEGKDVVGSEFANEVKFFDRMHDYSTTNILENGGI